MSPLAHRLPGGIQAQVCETRVSCSGSANYLRLALGGAQCGEQRRPDLKHIETGLEFVAMVRVRRSHAVGRDRHRLGADCRCVSSEGVEEQTVDVYSARNQG